VTALGDLPASELREHLHRVADWIADYRETIDARRITPRVERGAVAARLPTSLPAEPAPLDDILDDFERLIVPAVVHWGHPAFFGYFGSTTTAPGIVAEALTAALNVSAMMWQVSPAATELEEVVVDWLRQLIHLPADFRGVVYDTASVATLHALAAARSACESGVRRDGLSGLPPLVVYASDAAHSSIDKAAIVLGLGERGVTRLPTDDTQRLRVDALRLAVAADRHAGRRPCAVVATVGTTETAAVDPVADVAAAARELGLWLHVDAAYGGAIGLLHDGRDLMAGVGLADSVVVNPHKWLFVPLDFSVLFTRRPDAIRGVFALTPAYLRGDAGDGARNAMDYSLALGRRFRALKAWMVWRALGADGLAARVQEHVRLARTFAGWVAADTTLELFSVNMGVVCFRARTTGGSPEHADRLNEAIVDEVNRRGNAYLTRTRIHGKSLLRLGLGNILTEERHLRRAWCAIRDATAHARRLLPAAPARP
jgi:aromatic-L-amino-acid decarboxylase